ncbi:MAG TPA: AsmA-like C-terminal region-containing protein [Saprospiraceae bacterium]|nr:AsmA-like C-terminal region-containing protein [Saprospiraceae bacterium]
MNKKKILNAFKVLIILFLLLGILFLGMIHWKSEAVITRVVALIQNQMEDSLKYDDISLEWIRYFPSAALQLNGLKIGSTENPLIDGGTVDVVLRLFPLLKEKIIINKLMITNSQIHISKNNGRWTYDLFKKGKKETNTKTANVSSNNDNTGWKTLIKQVQLENTDVFYDDRDGLIFELAIDEGKIDGNLTGSLFDAELDLTAELKRLKMNDYVQDVPFPFEMKGNYKYESKEGYQEIKNWKIHNDGIQFQVNGTMRKEPDHNVVDMHVAWADSDPQYIKALIPSQNISNWNEYVFSGKSKGQLEIKGNSSKVEKPHIQLSSELKNGSIKFPGDGGQLKNMLVDVAYDNGDTKTKDKTYLRANLRHGTFEGNDLKADILIDNPVHPVLNAELSGSLPASILNLFLDSTSWNFKNGFFDIDHYKINGLSLGSISTMTFVDKSEGELTAENIQFNYNGDEIVIGEGGMKLDASGKMKLDVEEFLWNKAKGENIEGEILFAGNKVDFNLNGKHSQGNVNVKGNLILGTKPVLNADWKVKGIEMKDLLTSFENFDQTFITSNNLEGKADIWSQSTIPYDAKGNILAKEIVLRAAIDIKDGKLKDLKTLEDFSKYVHLDDLRDIKFSEFRNYMKIEGGKVFLPVMFLQSNAINMSINGVHSFNQDILYNLKLNAGQAATNKVKKFDPLRKLKQARKSGWINMYFVLSGTVDNVKYEQDQKQVISSFEQSKQLKETLRNYLVDKFGHEVYWLEPNEWEDIPEYK